MSAFALPARRGDFLYSSILYADPGNGNHHPRASVAELAALLRPEAPNMYSKGRKPEASSPAKDPAWHFYSAQLIHYGLPVTKDKNGAKVRLLNAMNQFKLEVPAWVLKVEGELKNEWEAENRKMKKSGGVAIAMKDQAGGKGKSKTAQGAGGDVNVTVNLSLSSGLSMVQQFGVQQSQGAVPKKPSPTKRKRADSDTPTKAVKVKQEPALTKKVKKEAVSRNVASRINQEQIHPSPPTTPSRSRLKQEYSLPLPQRSQYTSSPRIKIDPYTNIKGNQGTILSGIYEIDCSIASDMFNEYNLDLTLAFDAYRDTWWASFRWGAWDGIMKMDPGPTYTGTNQPWSLGWRLRDLQTGQLKFGKKCTGVMTFFEDGTLVGELNEVPGAGTVEFAGRRLVGPSLEDDLQNEWDGFVSEAYRR